MQEVKFQSKPEGIKVEGKRKHIDIEWKNLGKTNCDVNLEMTTWFFRIYKKSKIYQEIEKEFQISKTIDGKPLLIDLNEYLQIT